MKREISEFEGGTFDVLVVGGGALGAWTAREATLRGWRTALIEAADFGGGASWNNLKIVHGGLRYLQRLDFRRMRESIRERSLLLRIAPHLVHPLPVLVPAFASGQQRRFLLEAASRVNDLVSWDRNRGLSPERRLPPTQVLSRPECLARLPTEPAEDVTGGIVFHDAQIYAPERLVVEIVKDASHRGATVANYVECRGLRDASEPTMRVDAVDRTTDRPLEIRTRCLVNATGASARRLAERMTGQDSATDLRYSVALNLLLDPMGHDVAFTLPATQPNPGARVDVGKRQLLFVPWRAHTLVGTGHYPYSGETEPSFRVDQRHVEMFLQEVGTALPDRRISAEDVNLVHSGLLPERAHEGPGVDLLPRGRVIDHGRTGQHGVFTVISVKFTTCRALAERVLGRAADSLDRSFPAAQPVPPLRSAPEEPVGDHLAAVRREFDQVDDEEVIEHLVRTYGSESREVLSLAVSLSGGMERLHPESPVIAGQIVHAARREMAQDLGDILQRRTELGPRGLITEKVCSDAQAFLSRCTSGAQTRRR